MSRDYSVYPCCFSPEHRRRLGEAMTGRKLSAEHRQNLSEAITEFYRDHPKASKGKRNGFFGKKHSLTTCQRMSKSKTEFYQNHPEAHRNTRTRQGKFFSKKNGGIWLHYRSSWEKNWYQLLEKLTKVKSYRVEPVIVEYHWKGGTHHYLPDLLVLYIDGTRDLVEVKPGYRRKDSKNQAKFKAARLWCARCHRYPTSFKVVGKGE